LMANPPQVDSPYFESADQSLEVHDSAYDFASATSSQDNYEAVASALTPSCLSAFVNGAHKSLFVGHLQKGQHVGTITVTATNPALYGGGTAGFVIGIPVTSGGISVTVAIRSVYLLRGSLLQQVTFTSFDQAFPSSLAARLIGIAAGRTAAVAASLAAPTITTEPIPSTLPLVPDPAAGFGPESIPVPNGPPLAGLEAAATGETVDGIQCQTNEQTVDHVHTHLTIFVNGQAQVIPAGIGIPGAQAVRTRQGPFVQSGDCFYWLHTHAMDGIIHIESPRQSLQFTLGQFFDEWGQTLTATQVGPDRGVVTTFVNGALYSGDPRAIPLGDHTQIQLNVGTPVVAPVHLDQWGDL
jgi:hypothetical protein